MANYIDLEKIVLKEEPVEDLKEIEEEPDIQTHYSTTTTDYSPTDYYSTKIVYEQTTQSNNDPDGELYISKTFTKKYNNISGKLE